MKLLNQKGEIDYSKFLLSSKDAKLYLKKEKLIQVFKYFDVDNSWFIEKMILKMFFLEVEIKFIMIMKLK